MCAYVVDEDDDGHPLSLETGCSATDADRTKEYHGPVLPRFLHCRFRLHLFLHPHRARVCEELNRQPEFMRDLVEMGINLEDCELWFERAVLATLALVVILVVIRVSRPSS